MFLETLSSLLIFFVTVPGLGWLLARRLPFAPAEKIAAAAALSLLGAFAGLALPARHRLASAPKPQNV